VHSNALLDRDSLDSVVSALVIGALLLPPAIALWGGARFVWEQVRGRRQAKRAVVDDLGEKADGGHAHEEHQEGDSEDGEIASLLKAAIADLKEEKRTSRAEKLEKDAEIDAKDAEIDAKDAENQNLKAAVDEKDAENQGLKVALQAKDAVARRFEQEVALLTAQLAELKGGATGGGGGAQQVDSDGDGDDRVPTPTFGSSGEAAAPSSAAALLGGTTKGHDAVL